MSLGEVVVAGRTKVRRPRQQKCSPFAPLFSQCRLLLSCTFLLFHASPLIWFWQEKGTAILALLASWNLFNFFTANNFVWDQCVKLGKVEKCRRAVGSDKGEFLWVSWESSFYLNGKWLATLLRMLLSCTFSSPDTVTHLLHWSLGSLWATATKHIVCWGPWKGQSSACPRSIDTVACRAFQYERLHRQSFPCSPLLT